MSESSNAHQDGELRLEEANTVLSSYNVEAARALRLFSPLDIFPSRFDPLLRRHVHYFFVLIK